MFNQITLLGYLGKDASSNNNNGTIVTKFSVATKKSWKDQNDEWQEKSQWHQVVCFGENFEAMTSRSCQRRASLRPRSTHHSRIRSHHQSPRRQRQSHRARHQAARRRSQSRHHPHPRSFGQHRQRSGRAGTHGGPLGPSALLTKVSLREVSRRRDEVSSLKTPDLDPT